MKKAPNPDIIIIKRGGGAATKQGGLSTYDVQKAFVFLTLSPHTYLLSAKFIYRAGQKSGH